MMGPVRRHYVVCKDVSEGGPLRHIGQAAAHELVVPQLGGDDRGESHFHGEPGERSCPHFTKAFPPARHFTDIKVTGAAQRILT